MARQAQEGRGRAVFLQCAGSRPWGARACARPTALNCMGKSLDTCMLRPLHGSHFLRRSLTQTHLLSTHASLR